MDGINSNCWIFLGVIVALGMVLVWLRRSNVGYGRENLPGGSLEERIEDLDADERMIRKAELSRRERSNQDLMRKLRELEEKDKSKLM